MLFELLWRAGSRTGDTRYFAAVDITLDHICEGGIYDHLGGGFSRYSVDERWLVLHLKKCSTTTRSFSASGGRGNISTAARRYTGSGRSRQSNGSSAR